MEAVDCPLTSVAQKPASNKPDSAASQQLSKVINSRLVPARSSAKVPSAAFRRSASPDEVTSGTVVNAATNAATNVDTNADIYPQAGVSSASKLMPSESKEATLPDEIADAVKTSANSKLVRVLSSSKLVSSAAKVLSHEGAIVNPREGNVPMLSKSGSSSKAVGSSRTSKFNSNLVSKGNRPTTIGTPKVAAITIPKTFTGSPNVNNASQSSNVHGSAKFSSKTDQAEVEKARSSSAKLNSSKSSSKPVGQWKF